MSGAEALYTAAALYAGGTAVDYAAKQQSAGERRSILNQAFADSQKTTDEATKLLSNEGEKYQSDARRKAIDAQEAATLAQSQQDLATAGAGGDLLGGAAAEKGNVSSDFIKAKTDRALTEGNRLTDLARETAKARAPGLQLIKEKDRQGDLLSRTGAMWNGTNARSRAASADAEMVTDPWWGALGKLAQAAALAYATGGSGAGAGAGTGTWYTGSNAAGVGAALA